MSYIGPKYSTSMMDAIADPNLFGVGFKNIKTWYPWFIFLKALLVEPMSFDERKIFRKCTGRTRPPSRQPKEGWLIVGRRGGKSYILALIAVFLAFFRDWRPFLSPGEVATIMVISVDRRQARTIFRYIGGFIDQNPMLKALEIRKTTEVIELSNKVIIEVHTASHRTARGYSAAAILLDEIAFWRSDESTNPDREILKALRPNLLTLPGSLLLGCSSPYAEKGVLFERHKKYFGKNSDRVLIWQAASRIMNKSLSKREIQEEYDDDPVSAAAEYGARFRKDVQSLITLKSYENCVIPGRPMMHPVPGETYRAFTDPSGGSTDSMTLAIGHKNLDENITIMDFYKEIKPPFSPDAVVKEFCNDMKRYHISKVRGDRYAGEWPRERFRKNGIYYEVCTTPKSDLYKSFVSVLNSQGVETFDDDVVKTQFCSLERRTGRGGRDVIDHPPRAHDDIANAIAGVVQDFDEESRLEMW